MSFIRSAFAACATLGLLGACGGGGSSEPPAAAPPPAAAVAITVDNETAIARAAVEGSAALTGAQVLENDDRSTALSVRGAPGERRAFVGIARRALELVQSPQRRQTLQAGKVRALGILEEEYACSLGGMLTLSIDDQNNDGLLSTGELMTMSFAQCNEPEGSMNGNLVMTMSSVSSSTQFGGTLTFQAVTISVDGSTTTVDGTVGFDYVGGSQTELVMTVGSAGLNTSISSAVYDDAVVYEPGLRIELIDTGTSSSSSLDGSFSATSIDGLITVTTPQAIVQQHVDVNPSAGQVLVVGAGGSQLLVTVLDATQVRIELDANGDGTFERLTVVTWQELLSQ